MNPARKLYSVPAPCYHTAMAERLTQSETEQKATLCSLVVIMLAIGPTVCGLKMCLERWILRAIKSVANVLLREVKQSAPCSKILRLVNPLKPNGNLYVLLVLICSAVLCVFGFCMVLIVNSGQWYGSACACNAAASQGKKYVIRCSYTYCEMSAMCLESSSCTLWHKAPWFNWRSAGHIRPETSCNQARKIIC
jgi:hypothetical protein